MKSVGRVYSRDGNLWWTGPLRCHKRRRRPPWKCRESAAVPSSQRAESRRWAWQCMDIQGEERLVSSFVACQACHSWVSAASCHRTIPGKNRHRHDALADKSSHGQPHDRISCASCPLSVRPHLRSLTNAIEAPRQLGEPASLANGFWLGAGGTAVEGGWLSMGWCLQWLSGLENRRLTEQWGDWG